MRLILAATAAAAVLAGGLATVAAALPADAPQTFHGVTFLADEHITAANGGLTAHAEKVIGPFDQDAVLVVKFDVRTSYAAKMTGEMSANAFDWSFSAGGKTLNSASHKVSQIVAGEGPWSMSTGNKQRLFLRKGETTTLVLDAANHGGLEPARASTAASIDVVAIAGE